MIPFLAGFEDTVLPGLGGLLELAAILLVVAILSVLGAVVAGRRRTIELDVLYGWGLAAALFTFAGVATSLRFTWIAVAILIGSLLCGVLAFRHEKRLFPPGGLRMVFLAFPVFLIVAAMSPTQWDELRHWLPNARYLFEVDRFPSVGGPPSESGLPGYPHGLAFVIYAVSRLTGSFAEQAGALFNVILLLCLALVVLRVVKEALRDDFERAGLASASSSQAAPSWGACAGALLAVSALNPTFVVKIVFSAYAEIATAVCLAGCVALSWFASNALAAGDRLAAKRTAWQLGLVATALVAIKQVNAVLFASVIAGLTVVGWRDPRIRLADLTAVLAVALALPVAVYVAWRLHLHFGTSGGELSVSSVANWKFDLIPTTLARMALIATKKGGYFAIMLVAVGFAARALVRFAGAFDRLAVMTAVLFVLYNLFLLFIYIAAFSEYEAAHAASYWRYNTHLGGVGLLFATCCIVRWSLKWRLLRPRRAFTRFGPAILTLAVLSIPVAMADRLRFDRNAGYGYVRLVAGDIARDLEASDRLVTFDPEDNGQYLVLLRYSLHGAAQIVHEFGGFSDQPLSSLRDVVDAKQATHVWLRRPTPESTALHGPDLAPNYSYLLVRRGERWDVKRRWKAAERNVR